MNFKESLSVIPRTLRELYETTISLNTPSTWNRLMECVVARMEGFANQRRRLSAAAEKVIESQKALIGVHEKIKNTPKSHQKDLLDLTFESGVTFAIMSLDKANYESLSKINGDLDGQFEAMLCFSDQIKEQMKNRFSITSEELTELGQQQKGYGKDGYYRTDQPLPSFPSRPPLHPTANPLTGSNATTEACYCLFCHKYVPVEHDMSTGKTMCEHHAHKCSDGNLRMLTTVIHQGGDTRPDSDDLATRAKHPHSGVKEHIFYKCPICTKVSQIQNPVDVRDKKTCPFCYATLSDKDIVDEPDEPAK